MKSVWSFIVSRPPFPPFSETTAAQKVRAAEDGWNSRDPQRVTQAYAAKNAVWISRSKPVCNVRFRDMGCNAARSPPHVASDAASAKNKNPRSVLSAKPTLFAFWRSNSALTLAPTQAEPSAARGVAIRPVCYCALRLPSSPSRSTVYDRNHVAIPPGRAGDRPAPSA
ncbi:DUF1348 family protein [uncultured Tateyamaria sp.]|uniref:DUF1348 family protein n=1 Tax=uncultured Tateyamaria sp. TaxID=455651 RepID=UPI00261E7DA2|nr:DUF1348 family protein [uncultured Tateyamaria sp.]